MDDRQLRSLLAEQVSPRQGRGLWRGGPTIIGALRGVSARQAAWRPAPGRKSIWELALHIGYWHYAIARRLGARRVDFPRSPANWPAQPARATEAAWKADKALVAALHRAVARAIRAVPPASYGRRPEGNRKWTFGETILGAGQHEAYHTGQIQLLKRLWAAR